MIPSVNTRLNSVMRLIFNSVVMWISETGATGYRKSSSHCRLTISSIKDHGVVCHIFKVDNWSNIHRRYGHRSEVLRVTRASFWPWNGSSQHDKPLLVHARKVDLAHIFMMLETMFGECLIALDVEKFTG